MPTFRRGRLLRGVLVATGGRTRDTAEAELVAGRAARVSFGTPFLANPDLVLRCASGAPLATADRATCYSGGARGIMNHPEYG